MKKNRDERASLRVAQEYLEETLGYPLVQLARYPRYVQIETISACNARCIMCGIDFEQRRLPLMDDLLFTKILNDLTAHRHLINKVFLNGLGEPLLDKKLAQRVDAAKRAGLPWVSIQSNGSLLTEKLATGLLEAGLDEINITIDSLDPQIYEAIRVGLNFATVYGNVRRFIELRNQINPQLVLRIQMVLQEKNRHEEESFVEHWQPFLEPHDQLAVQKAHNWASSIDAVVDDDDEINRLPCISLWGTAAITSSGQVALCCVDTESQHPLGDMRSQSMEEIWQGSILAKIQHLHANGQREQIKLCDGCTVWRPERRSLITGNSDE